MKMHASMYLLKRALLRQGLQASPSLFAFHSPLASILQVLYSSLQGGCIQFYFEPTYIFQSSSERCTLSLPSPEQLIFTFVQLHLLDCIQSRVDSVPKMGPSGDVLTHELLSPEDNTSKGFAYSLRLLWVSIDLSLMSVYVLRCICELGCKIKMLCHTKSGDSKCCYTLPTVFFPSTFKGSNSSF